MLAFLWCNNPLVQELYCSLRVPHEHWLNYVLKGALPPITSVLQRMTNKKYQSFSKYSLLYLPEILQAPFNLKMKSARCSAYSKLILLLKAKQHTAFGPDKLQEIGIKPHWCLQGRKGSNILSSPFSWWVDQAVLEYRNLRMQQEQAGTTAECAIAIWRVNPLKSFPWAAWGSSGLWPTGPPVFLLKDHFGGGVSQNGKTTGILQFTVINTWVINSLMARLPPSEGSSVSLLGQHSPGALRQWVIQGCFRRWRTRRNTDRLVLVYYLIV